MPHQAVTSLVQVLCFPLCLVLSIFPSINSFCFPFPHVKCPKYCSFLRNVCFAWAISKTSTLVFLSKYDIRNMCQKIHISKALILSSICLFSPWFWGIQKYGKYIAPTRRFLSSKCNFRDVNISHLCKCASNNFYSNLNLTFASTIVCSTSTLIFKVLYLL